MPQKLDLQPIQPKLDLQPITPPATPPPSDDTWLSSVGKGLSNFFSGLGQTIQTGVNTQGGSPLAVLMASQQMAEPLVTHYPHPENAFPNLADYGERIARFGAGQFGIPYDDFDKHYNEGNVGAMLGDLTVPLGMLGLSHKFGSTEAPEDLSKRPKIPLTKEQVGMKNSLGNGPKLLNAGTPGQMQINPEVDMGPRFIAGRAGIADRTIPYLHDPLDIAKTKFQDVQEGPNGEWIGAPSVLPHEISPAMVDVGPFVAAERNPFGVYKDIAQQNPAFEALVPNRLRSEKDILGMTGPDYVPGVTKEYGGARPMSRTPDTPMAPWETLKSLRSPRQNRFIGFVDRNTGDVTIKDNPNNDIHGKIFGTGIYSTNHDRFWTNGDKLFWSTSDPSPSAVMKLADRFPNLEQYEFPGGRKIDTMPPPTIDYSKRNPSSLMDEMDEMDELDRNAKWTRAPQGYLEPGESIDNKRAIDELRARTGRNESRLDEFGFEPDRRMNSSLLTDSMNKYVNKGPENLLFKQSTIKSPGGQDVILPHLPQGILSELFNNKSISDLVGHLADSLEELRKTVNENVTVENGWWNPNNEAEIHPVDVLKKFGISIDPSVRGYFTRNGDNTRGIMMLNPFEQMHLFKNPQQAAAGWMATLVHEMSHVPGGGHDEGAMGRMADMFEWLGDKDIKMRENFVNAVTNPEDRTQYNPEVSQALSAYKRFTGRGDFAERPTSGNEPLYSRRQQPNGASSEPSKRAINELSRLLGESITARQEQNIARSQESGKRLGAALGVKQKGLEGFKKQLGKLKGSYPEAEAPEPKFTDKHVNDLINAVTDNPDIKGWEQIRAKMALFKLATGEKVLQPNEIQLLTKAFGPEVGSQIKYLYGGFGMGPIEGIKPIQETGNFFKAIMSSIDFSAPFRQAWPVMNRMEFWRNFKTMWNVAKDKGADTFNEVMDSIKEHPLYEQAKAAGVKFTDVSDYANREEAFHSKLAEKIPGVLRSERAYTAYLNKLRMDLFAKLHEDGKLTYFDDMKEFNDPARAKGIADYVNNGTGRGTFASKKMEAAMPVANSVFFSPRLIKSRLHFLNPLNYVQADPFVRQQYLKSVLAAGEIATVMYGLGKATGASQEGDIRSSDFGKLKYGNTRLDWMGGFQQYLVAASRILTNSEKESSGKVSTLGAHYGSPTGLDIAERFGESKLSPMASFVATMLRHKDFQGAPANVKTEIGQRIFPLFLQDMAAIAKDNPKLLPLGAFGLFGMGLQTYDSSNGKVDYNNPQGIR